MAERGEQRLAQFATCRAASDTILSPSLPVTSGRILLTFWKQEAC